MYEFRFGSEFKPRPSLEEPLDAWTDYSYMKKNVAGVQKEWWFHRSGCRQWFLAVRNTVTNEVFQTFFPEDDPNTNEVAPAG